MNAPITIQTHAENYLNERKRSTPPSKNFLHTWVSLIFFGG